MTDAASLFKNQLRQAIAIQEEIVSASVYIDPVTKKALIQSTALLLAPLTNHELTLSQLKSLSNDLFIYWHESIGVDVEAFWARLQNEGIGMRRKDELTFAITNGRFRRVEQAIASKNYWHLLRNMPSVQDRFSESERDKVQEIIDQDEQTRLTLLKKCLAKKSIPKSKYLKFGECMAYFGNCGLFDRYFSLLEIEDLYRIWNS